MFLDAVLQTVSAHVVLRRILVQISGLIQEFSDQFSVLVAQQTNKQSDSELHYYLKLYYIKSALQEFDILGIPFRFYS